jgi:hypothetical protein
MYVCLLRNCTYIYLLRQPSLKVECIWRCGRYFETNGIHRIKKHKWCKISYFLDHDTILEQQWLKIQKHVLAYSRHAFYTSSICGPTTAEGGHTWLLDYRDARDRTGLQISITFALTDTSVSCLWFQPDTYGETADHEGWLRSRPRVSWAKHLLPPLRERHANILDYRQGAPAHGRGHLLHFSPPGAESTNTPRLETSSGARLTDWPVTINNRPNLAMSRKRWAQLNDPTSPQT